MYRLIKRAGDLVFGIFGLIILSPLFIITAIMIKAEDKGPVFFAQDRIGLNGKRFAMYKFRSMKVGADEMHEQMREEYGCDEVSFKLRDDPRETKAGKFIRKTNIDELPQLLNIIKGEMSFVGPRPLPVYEYKEEQAKYKGKYDLRYSVPQGLTCIWQIANRSDVDFEERMKMDVEYAGKCSIWMDIKLFALTALFTATGKSSY